MAASKPLRSEVEDIITCPICMETCDVPLMLPCLHNFCKKCLRNYVTKNVGQTESTSTTFRCPTCQREVKDGDLESLPVNFLINSLKDALSSVTKRTETCDECGSQDDNREKGSAVWRCLDCAKSLCGDCKSCHDRVSLASGKHSVISLADLRNLDKADVCIQSEEICAKHPTEMLKFYCADCEEALCGDCDILGHMGHQCKDMSDVIQETRTEIEDIVVQLRAIKRNISGVLDTLDRKADELAKAQRNIMQGITQHKTKVMDRITAYFDDLEKQVLNYALATDKEFKQSVDIWTTRSVSLQSACELGERVVKDGRRTEVLVAFRRLSEIRDSSYFDDECLNEQKKPLKFLTYQPGRLEQLKCAKVLGKCEQPSKTRADTEDADHMVDCAFTSLYIHCAMPQSLRGYFTQVPQFRHNPRWSTFGAQTSGQPDAALQTLPSGARVMAVRPKITGQWREGVPFNQSLNSATQRMSKGMQSARIMRPVMSAAPGQSTLVTNYKYTPASRGVQPATSPQTMSPQVVYVQDQEPLNTSMLAVNPPQEQKQMLGERLFPLIQCMHPELAGKITGMLLKIDNSELLHMLESRESLKAKVAEAVTVLQAHQAKQAGARHPSLR